LSRSPHFTIRSACTLTGINANTLRSWERRYGLIAPRRTQKGYRLFSEQDLERLQRIQRILQRGVPISQVAGHLDAEIPSGGKSRSAESSSTSGVPATRTVSLSLENVGLEGSVSIRLPARERTNRAVESLSEFADALERAAIEFDRPALEQTFARATGAHSLRDAFYDALAPALRNVGERYLRAPEGIAQEHFLSSFARERLSAALAGLRPLHQGPRVLCACVPGEVHDIMLMLLTLDIGLAGVSTLYLGADMPTSSLEHAMHRSGVRVVALSATVVMPMDDLSRMARRLAAMRRPPLLLVGGPAALREREWLAAEGIGLLPNDPREAAATLATLANAERTTARRRAAGGRGVRA
jgi:MerR family transcriptional regulator, light-induced transcriptional regulator